MELDIGTGDGYPVFITRGLSSEKVDHANTLSYSANEEIYNVPHLPILICFNHPVQVNTENNRERRPYKMADNK